MLIYPCSGVLILRLETEHIDYELINGWLIDYKRAENKYLRSKYRALITTLMLPVIKRIARTIARRSYDPVEDMVQAGAIGLLKSIDSFTPNTGTEFRIYAGRLIIGEMKHFLRDKMNSIRVPRHIQELVYRINTFTASLTPEELYDLTSADVAMALNVPANAVDFALQADRRTSVISLEDLYNSNSDENLGYEEVIAKDDYKELSEMEDARLILSDIVKKLPDDCRKIVELYYHNDMSQREIAAALNLSPMSVSRRMKKAFSILYKMIADSETETTKENTVSTITD